MLRVGGGILRRLCLARQPVLDEIFINKNESLLLILPIALFVVAVLKSVFSYGQNYLMSYVGNRVITDIRQELFGSSFVCQCPIMM